MQTMSRIRTTAEHAVHPEQRYRLSDRAIRWWTIGNGAVMALSVGVPLLIDAIWGPLPSGLLDTLTVVAIAGLLVPLAISAVVGGYAVGPYGALAGGVLVAGIALVVLSAQSGPGLPGVIGGVAVIIAGSIGMIVIGRRNRAHTWIYLAGAKVMERNAPEDHS